MDVKTAYLNANIDADIFIEQPKGFEEGKNDICHLNKSIYGLKQSRKLWNKLIHKFLSENDFTRSSVDHCLYIKKCTDSIVCNCR